MPKYRVERILITEIEAADRIDAEWDAEALDDDDYDVLEYNIEEIT